MEVENVGVMSVSDECEFGRRESVTSFMLKSGI